MLRARMNLSVYQDPDFAEEPLHVQIMEAGQLIDSDGDSLRSIVIPSFCNAFFASADSKKTRTSVPVLKDREFSGNIDSIYAPGGHPKPILLTRRIRFALKRNSDNARFVATTLRLNYSEADRAMKLRAPSECFG